VSALAFGNRNVSSTSTAQTVQLNNTGNTALSVTSVSASGSFAESNTCPASLAAGASCTASVTFTPTAMGPQSGTLTFVTAAGNQTVSLGGTGLQTSDSTNVGSLAFGNQKVSTTSAAQSVQLSNSGNTAVSITSVSATGPFAAASNCASSLAVG
jgi:hypothetical protein